MSSPKKGQSTQTPLQARSVGPSIPAINNAFFAGSSSSSPVTQAVPSAKMSPFNMSMGGLPLNMGSVVGSGSPNSKTLSKKKKSNSRSNSPAVSSLSNFPRINYQEKMDNIRKVIQHKHRITEYFTMIGKYLAAKVSKLELDNCVIKLFGWENAHLHNELFLAILHNSQTMEPPDFKALEHVQKHKNYTATALATPASSIVLDGRKRERNAVSSGKSKRPKSNVPSIKIPESGLGCPPISSHVSMGYDLSPDQLNKSSSPLDGDLHLPTKAYMKSVLEHHASLSRGSVNSISSSSVEALEKGLLLYLRQISQSVSSPIRFLSHLQRNGVSDRIPHVFEKISVRSSCKLSDPSDPTI